MHEVEHNRDFAPRDLRRLAGLALMLHYGSIPCFFPEITPTGPTGLHQLQFTFVILCYIYLFTSFPGFPFPRKLYFNYDKSTLHFCSFTNLFM